MIPIPSGVRVWLATGRTDMRKGFDGLALIVQETLKRDPHCGHLFVFRGRRGDLIKILWHAARACACSPTSRTRPLSVAVGGRWDGEDLSLQTCPILIQSGGDDRSRPAAHRPLRSARDDPCPARREARRSAEAA